MSPETAYIIGAFMMLANGGVLGLVHRDLLPALRPSAVSWRIGTLLIAGGCLVILTQRKLPPGFVLPVANGLIMLGLTGYWRALRQFYGIDDRFWLLLPAVIGTLGVFWFSAVEENIGLRVFIVTVCWLILFTASAATLLSMRQNDTALSRRALAGIFIFASLFSLVRLVFFLNPFDIPVTSVIEPGSWINVATPMMAGILPVVGTSAFLLMCSERLRRQLERAASTDYLTGLANRRTLAEAGAQRFRAARESGKPLAVALIDIDHFKSVNDRFGHETGDLALKHVASTLERTCRSGELPGRQGGEEFVVVLGPVSPEEALNFGERLRAAVESAPFSGEGLNLSVTISVGIACQSDNDDCFDRLLGRADNALYLAKANGRNRVELVS